MRRKSKNSKNQTLPPARSRNRKLSEQSSIPTTSRYWSYIWKGVSTIIAILGAYVTYLEFSPTFSVAVTESLDSSMPLYTPFTITNSGLLPVRNLTIRCKLYDLEDLDQGTERGSIYSRSDDFAPLMRPSEAITVTCPTNNFSSSPVIRADIAIAISFNATLPIIGQEIPYKINKDFRFCTRLDANRNPRWFQQPMTKDCFWSSH